MDVGEYEQLPADMLEERAQRLVDQYVKEAAVEQVRSSTPPAILTLPTQPRSLVWPIRLL
jgi:hypothetical protein